MVTPAVSQTFLTDQNHQVPLSTTDGPPHLTRIFFAFANAKTSLRMTFGQFPGSVFSDRRSHCPSYDAYSSYGCPFSVGIAHAYRLEFRFFQSSYDFIVLAQAQRFHCGVIHSFENARWSSLKPLQTAVNSSPFLLLYIEKNS